MQLERTPSAIKINRIENPMLRIFEYFIDRCELLLVVPIQLEDYFYSLRRASSASFRLAFASFFALFFSSLANFLASFCLVFSAFSSSFWRAFSAFSRSFSLSFSFFDFWISWTTDSFGADWGLFDVDFVDDEDVELFTLLESLGVGDVSNWVTIFWAHLVNRSWGYVVYYIANKFSNRQIKFSRSSFIK